MKVFVSTLVFGLFLSHQGIALPPANTLERDLLAQYRKDQNVNRLRAQSGTAYKRYTRSPVPPYLMAYSEYLSGNVEGAIGLAIEAQKRAKKNPAHRKEPRYAETIKDLRAGKAEPFKFSH